MSILSKSYFHVEADAFAHLEAIIWPDGPTCPHCGECERIGVLEGVRSKPSKKNPQGVLRHGLKKCYSCRKQFTVRVGTVFESSHVPLTKWLQATYLMMSSKKGISAKQLERTLEVTYKTAWFMAHRLREAMRTSDLDIPFGSGGGVVEIDETYVGGKTSHRKWKAKTPMLTLVDRESGRSKSFVLKRATKAEILPIIRENLAEEARVVTDESGVYKNLDTEYMHAFVTHSKKQWGRGIIHTNTVEGYYSVFKKGMQGVYQHCGRKHLHRYAAEFDFRYSYREARGTNDMERTDAALAGIVGKRLTYRRANGKSA